MKMYDGWMGDAAKAAAHWTVVAQLQDGMGDARGDAAEFTDDWQTRLVEAIAKTGSRYAVHVARLGLAADRMGGDVLVSVLQPWQAAYPMSETGYLTMDYVAEHLTAGRGMEGRLHGGDLAAITMTICHALGRQHDVVMSVAGSRTEA